MGNKKTLGIVFGRGTQPRCLSMFDGFQDAFDVHIYAIESEFLLNRQTANFKLHVFEDVDEMPGFMRNLDDQLDKCDLVIVFETSQLSSFQAIRASLKKDIPCVALTTEFTPYFYANYPNIRAVQLDVLGHASGFLASSKLAEDLLRIEGVKKEDIHYLPPLVNTKFFSPSEARRQKFREYIRIPANDKLIVFQQELTEESGALEMLNAFKLLLTTSKRPDLKLLFAGDGPLADDLKYRAFDQGIGARVMFMHQDPTPFIADLYASSDVIVNFKSTSKEYHEQIPFHILEAMASGVVPVVYQGSIAQEFSADIGLPMKDNTFQGACQSLAMVLDDQLYDLESEKKRARKHVEDHFSLVGQAQMLDNIIQWLGEIIEGAEKTRYDYDAAIGQIDEKITGGEREDALVKIEDLMLRLEENSRHKSELFRCKGDILMNESRFDEGMSAYSESLKFDDSNFRSYRGLGYIAFNGHSHEDAITFFKKALAKKEDDVGSLLGVGLVHRRLGLNEEAIYWLERCVELDQENLRARTALIQACLDCPTFEKPIKTLSRLIDVKGEEPSLVLTLGQIFVKEGQVSKGNEMIQRALGMREQEDTPLKAS